MFVKHLKLLPTYIRLGLKTNTEYKFQFYTNIISRFLSFGVWLVFWYLLTKELPQIGSWDILSLIALITFYEFHLNFWQICFYSLNVSHEIVSGNIDKYMVRPIQPIFGIILDKIQLMSIVPLIVTGLILVYIGLVYSSFTKLILAYFVVIASVFTLHLAYISIGLLSFWFGRFRAFISIYRSMRSSSSFPLNILPLYLLFTLTLVFPASLFGTFPAMILFHLSWIDVLLVTFVATLVFLFWLFICVMLWKKGVRSYESFGG